MRYSVSTAAILISASLHAQTQPAGAPAFDVVSIKPSPPPEGRGMMQGTRGGPGTADPTLFRTVNYSLSNLIQDAFELVAWYRIAGPE